MPAWQDRQATFASAPFRTLTGFFSPPDAACSCAPAWQLMQLADAYALLPANVWPWAVFANAPATSVWQLAHSSAARAGAPSANAPVAARARKSAFPPYLLVMGQLPSDQATNMAAANSASPRTR